MVIDGWTVDRAWSWEGNVQATLAQHLTVSGWIVTAAADTNSKAPGIDLVATQAGRWLAIEVKGFPSTTYEHGDRRGEPKPTQPANQARQWFSHALLGMMLMRDKRPDAEIAIALPAFDTYRRLITRTSKSFTLLGFGVYLVAEDGSVSLPVPHHAVWSSPPSQSEEAND
jgi:hypothetical protein